ncbi:MAG: winged helix-turn-helix transcriptional regulator [Candidatus Devosia symbiotica]|nr:winged helix-turn-helix transcriptional regulator [Candidatus Devosia symbiotica]
MPDKPTRPVVDAVRMLPGKWKPMMLHMLVAEPLRFEEIVRRLAPMNRKVISEQLR